MNSELGIRNVGCVLALVMTFFTACTDYQEQFDNNFAALEYGDIENPELSSGVVPGSSGGSTIASSASVSSGAEPLSSGAVPASSGAEPLSSGTVPISSGDIQSSSSNPYVEENILTDARDSNKYKLVTIGSQVWMAENLNFETEKSRCYGDAPSYCNAYGRLYTWVDAQDVCPEGTHLPSYDEFHVLYVFVHEDNESNGSSEANFLKSKDGWKQFNEKTGGVDSYGFSAKPAGGYTDKGYDGIGEKTYFLTSDTTGGSATLMGIAYNNEYFGKALYSKENAFSVRCLVGEKKAELTSSSSGELSSSSSSVIVTSSSQAVQSSSSVKSSSSMKSSSSVKSSSSLAYHFQLPIYGIPYNVVTIGKQTWMADNMAEENPIWYHPEGKQSNWKYGRLYEWSTARGICPEGWHLPDSLEWQTLFNAVGGIKVAGGVLQSSNVYGKVEQMFAGFRNPASEFEHFDEYADFWINDDSGVKFVELQRGADEAYFMPNLGYMTGDLTGYAFSVRCIMDYIKDDHDGQTYRTVKIGDQVWTAENMNRDTEYSHCFNDSPDYCEKYGRLYKWDETSDVCPSGWRLPTKGELENLINTVGEEETAGDSLKTKTGWKTYSAGGGLSAKGVGEDSFGFSALPGGFRTYNGDVWYSDEDAVAYFCSSTTVDNGEGSYYMVLHWAHSYAQITSGQYACSVRCIKD